MNSNESNSKPQAQLQALDEHLGKSSDHYCSIVLLNVFI